MTWEVWIRVGSFTLLLVAFAIWEHFQPRRVRVGRRLVRWVSNLGLVVLSSVTVSLILPVSSLVMAHMAAVRGWGLFNNYEWPHALVFVLCVVALDFIIYAQHFLFHAVPGLWKLHQVHHSDIDLDATSGLRFHVIEIVLSMLVKLAAIVTLGPPVLAVLAFEVILNGTALFNHADIKLPPRVDALLRLFLVTPDMHRVHHSVIRCETDSNYGFNLSIWDRLFGTYRAQPQEGHEGMTIGVNAFREEREQWLDRLLLQPFRNAGSPSADDLDRGARTDTNQPE